ISLASRYAPLGDGTAGIIDLVPSSGNGKVSGIRIRSNSVVVPGWSEGPDLRCAIAHRGISRFRVRCFASPRNDGVGATGSSTAKTRNCPGDDLHGDANQPTRHDHRGPGDMRIVAEHDRAHGSKSRAGCEKCAHRAQKFRGVDLLDRVAVRKLTVCPMKTQGRGVDAKVKSDGAGD